MKRFILLAAVALCAAATASAQRLVIGERAPEFTVSRWLTAQPDDGKPMMLEFFHSSNPQSCSRLATLDRIARDNAGSLNVVVVTREDSGEVASMLTGGSPAYFVALDDGGKTFSAFAARYVPYCVILDKRGRVVWVGNPTSLDEETVLKGLNK